MFNFFLILKRRLHAITTTKFVYERPAFLSLTSKQIEIAGEKDNYDSTTLRALHTTPSI